MSLNEMEDLRDRVRFARQFVFTAAVYLTAALGGPVLIPSTKLGAVAEDTPGSIEPSKAARHTRLVILRAGNKEGAEKVVALAKPTGTIVFEETFGSVQNLLYREIMRQGLLISARDELGLHTRDEVLDNVSPGPGEDAEVDFITDLREDVSRIFVRRGLREKAETLLSHNLGPDCLGAIGSLPKLTSIAEKMTRSEFLRTLKALGLKGERNAWRKDGGLPANVEDRLNTLGFVENFAAVRDLHNVIRTDGESPARLGALVRGYSQLGVLSEFHWHPAHKVFKARALLYAQRLAVRQPEHPWGLWHRAFAEALVGLPQSARADLDQAKKQAGALKDGAAPPTWATLLEAFLTNDLDRLKDKATPHPKLGALLRLIAMEFASGNNLTLKVAKEVVSLDVECYRAHDSMCRIGGVTNLHSATLVGMSALSKLLPAKLAALETLPANVRAGLKQNGGELALLETLERAGSFHEGSGEPAWSVLAHLIRETRFVQIYRRLYFMYKVWGVPVDDFWVDARLFVENHRYLPFLETMVLIPSESSRSFARFAARIDLTDVEASGAHMLMMLASSRIDRVKNAWDLAYYHSDRVVRDMNMSLGWPQPVDQAKWARQLLEIDPRSPTAMAVLVTSDWEGVKDKIPDWVKTVGEFPALLGALATHYTNQKQFPQAQDMLMRYIQRNPEQWAYAMLADNYKAMGDRKRWKTTLDDYLKNVEDQGLGHASVRVQIANDLMEQKRWQEARPYAEAAAETWAHWAMSCAERCCEEIGDWPKAELWARRITERYEKAWDTWYRFCKRTGQGDVRAAQNEAERRLAEIGNRPDLIDEETVAYFLWSAGSLEKAQDGLLALAEADPAETTTLMHLALIADELGEIPRRDELLTTLWTKHQSQSPRGVQVCRVLRTWLGDGAKGPLDQRFIDKEMKGLSPTLRGNLEFFVGRFLTLHGKPELGRPYLERSADSTATNEWIRILAKTSLERLGPAKP